jgi:hypothetical protein
MTLSQRRPELEFLKILWGLGTEEEVGPRLSVRGDQSWNFKESMGARNRGGRGLSPGYIGWRNSFLGIYSAAPYTFKNTGSDGLVPGMFQVLYLYLV